MRNLLLATTLVISGAGWAQPGPAAFDPTGTWTYATRDDEGAPIAGTLAIAGEAGAYTGTVTSGPGRELAISDVLTSPNGMVVVANLPDGRVAVILPSANIMP